VALIAARRYVCQHISIVCRPGGLPTRRMWAFVLALLISVACPALGTAAADDTTDGFRPLFNGRDLRGWTFLGLGSDWFVGGGALRTSGSPRGWLLTDSEFDDFELRLEYRLSARADSGVLIRGARGGDPSRGGIEIQILDDGAYSSLSPTSYTGAVYSLAAPSRRATKATGEWNAMRIVANGRRINVFVNNNQVVDANLNDYSDQLAQKPWLTRNRGFVGLQSWNGKIEFRNINIRSTSASDSGRVAIQEPGSIRHSTGGMGVPPMMTPPIPAQAPGASSGVKPAPAADDSSPLLVVDSGGHTGRIWSLMFTPDSRQLISVATDQIIRFWDIESGKSTRVLRPMLIPAGRGGCGALSRDGRLLAVTRSGVQLNEQWINLIELPAARVAKVIATGHTAGLGRVVFSPDGKHIASAGSDATARVFNVASGASEHVFRGHATAILGIDISPDGRLLATSSGDETARIWSLETGESRAFLKDVDRRTFALGSIVFQPDGQGLVTGSWGDLARVWSLDGLLRRRLSVVTDHDTRFTMDPNRLLVARENVGEIIDFNTGAKTAVFSGHDSHVFTGAVSPDGKLAATAGIGGDSIRIWRIQDGGLVHKLPGGRAIWAVGWSSDGQTIAWGHTSNGGEFSEKPRPLERTFDLTEFGLGGSPQGAYERFRAKQGAYSFQRDQSTGIVKLRKDSADGVTLPGQWIAGYTFFGNDRFVINNSDGLCVYDGNTGKLVNKFEERANANDLCVSPDGRYLLAGGTDGIARILPINGQRTLLSLLVADNEWVAWTPEGYYAASPGGERLMGWQMNRGPWEMGAFYPASQFRKILYRPDVIARVLKDGSLDLALSNANAVAAPAAIASKSKHASPMDVARVLPPSVVITSQTGSSMRPTGKTLKIDAVARSAGTHPVTEMRVLLDGRPVPNAFTIFASPKLGEARASWTIPVPSNGQRVTVQATSGVSQGLSEPFEILVASDAPAASNGGATLYLLVVGINDYPDKRLKLDCAAPDAKSFHDAFTKYSRRLFPGGVKPRVLVNSQATRSNIVAGLRWLNDNAKSGDLAIVFYAGHGYCGKDGLFYIVPVDAKTSDLPGTGISGESLESSIGRLPSTTMLVLDACYAANIGAKKKRKTRALPVESDTVLRHLIYDSGLVVMCGAYKDQEAVEENGHGFFTQAIVEGLSGKADKYKIGRVEVDDLQTYVKHRVRQLSGNEQEPTIGIPPTVRSFSLSQP
jgi:WD40 repeat protein